MSVPCGDELKFFYDADGTETFSIGTKTDDNTRRYLEAYEVEAERDAFLAPLIAVRGGAVADAADVASSSSLEEGVEDVTSISSSSLRGAKGSKRSL